MHKPITAQDLLDLLPIVAGQGWEIKSFLDSASIRNAESRCPLCALAYAICPSTNYHEMACAAFLELGFSSFNNPGIKQIMGAADFHNHPLRPALMQALGMVK